MPCRLEIKDIELINPTNILPQTSFWGRIKHAQGFIPKGFELSVSKELMNPLVNGASRINDDLLIFIKYINSTQCFAYVPYGPEIEPVFENQGVFLEELSEVLRSYLPPECLFIRYDLKWQNQWSKDDEYFDQNGNWLGPPDTGVQEFRVNFKTENWNLRKSPVDVLPKNTFFLDLSRSDEDLLYNMRYNTRYNIRRGLKKGIRIQEYGIDQINEWYKLYAETALRHDMPMQNEQYFSSILQNQDNTKKGVHIKMLMADCDGQFLASMFLALTNKRGVYLYGASSGTQDNLMASYSLQWEAIKTAKRWGCTEYDMFGSAPNLNSNHPLHGVHIYKKGFGGKLYHRMGCWDYPYKIKEYELYKIHEQSLHN